MVHIPEDFKRRVAAMHGLMALDDLLPEFPIVLLTSDLPGDMHDV